MHALRHFAAYSPGEKAIALDLDELDAEVDRAVIVRRPVRGVPVDLAPDEFLERVRFGRRRFHANARRRFFLSEHRSTREEGEHEADGTSRPRQTPRPRHQSKSPTSAPAPGM